MIAANFNESPERLARAAAVDSRVSDPGQIRDGTSLERQKWITSKNG